MTSRTITVTLRRKTDAPSTDRRGNVVATNKEVQKPKAALGVSAPLAQSIAKAAESNPYSIAAKLAPVLKTMRRTPVSASTTAPDPKKDQSDRRPQQQDSDDAITAAKPQKRISDTQKILNDLSHRVMSALKASQTRKAADDLKAATGNVTISKSARSQIRFALNAVASFMSAPRSDVADRSDLGRLVSERLDLAKEAEVNAVTAFNNRQKEITLREQEGGAVRAASGGKFVPADHPNARALRKQISENGFAAGRAAISIVTSKQMTVEGQRVIREHFNGATVSSGMYILINDAVIVGMTAAYAFGNYGAGGARSKTEHKDSVLRFAEAMRGKIGNREPLDDVAMWADALWAVTFTRSDLNILRRACGGSLSFRGWGVAFMSA